MPVAFISALETSIVRAVKTMPPTANRSATHIKPNQAARDLGEPRTDDDAPADAFAEDGLRVRA